MKKVLIVSDSFKGSLSSTEICEIARNNHLDSFEVADGGEGTVSAFASLLQTDLIKVKTVDALLKPLEATYTIYDHKAIVEVASCVGLALTPNSNPKDTSTYGVGEIIKDALKRGCNEVYLGLGGSSTNDAGCGMAYALGCKFYDENNEEFMPVGKNLNKITRIDSTQTSKIKITAMCDVTNPLYGLKGAAYIFAPQKGANKDDVILLDAGLKHLSQVLKNNLEEKEGTGAAGGLGYGVLSFFNGFLQSGAKTVLDLANYEERIKAYDYIITGEGKLDSQSLDGKLISEVLKRSRNKNVIFLVGICELEDFDYPVYETNDKHLPFEEVKDQAYQDYQNKLKEILKDIE